MCNNYNNILYTHIQGDPEKPDVFETSGHDVIFVSEF